jgi:hypothetical protein
MNNSQQNKSYKKNNSLDKNRRVKTSRPTRRYTRDEKVAAVTAAKTVGREFPMSVDAIAAARRAAGAPISLQTLSNWLSEFGPIVDSSLPELSPRPVDTVISETRNNILADLVKIQKKAVDHLINSNAIEQSSARDASVVLGVATDKIKSLTDIDPAVSTIIKRLAELCQRTNMDIVALLEDFESVVNQELPTINIRAIESPKE